MKNIEWWNNLLCYSDDGMTPIKIYTAPNRAEWAKPGIYHVAPQYRKICAELNEVLMQMENTGYRSIGMFNPFIKLPYTICCALIDKEYIYPDLFVIVESLRYAFDIAQNDGLELSAQLVTDYLIIIHNTARLLKYYVPDIRIIFDSLNRKERIGQ
jgi:hypothetical protein